jgi:hypothetical protein
LLNAGKSGVNFILTGFLVWGLLKESLGPFSGGRSAALRALGRREGKCLAGGSFKTTTGVREAGEREKVETKS